MLLTDDDYKDIGRRTVNLARRALKGGMASELEERAFAQTVLGLLQSQYGAAIWESDDGQPEQRHG